MNETFKKLKKTKTNQICLNDVTDFIVMGCSTISVPIHKYIFNLRLLQQYLPTQWKQSIIVSVRRKMIWPAYKIIDLYRFLKMFRHFFLTCYE